MRLKFSSKSISALLFLLPLVAWSQACPDTKEGWQRALDRTAERMANDSIEYNTSCDDRMPPQISACYERVRKYSVAAGVANGRGGTADDMRIQMEHEKLAEKRPELFAFPSPLSEINSVDGLRRLYETCKVQEQTSPQCAKVAEWSILPMNSVVEGPGGRERIYVLVPGEKFDQWYAFFPGLGNQIDFVDQIVVERQSAGGIPLEQPRTHMVSNGIGGAHAAPGTCYRCHVNGPRIIHPTSGSAADTLSQSTLREMNLTAAKYMQVDMTHYFNPDDLGPPMGSRHGCTECHGNAIEGRRAHNGLTDKNAILSMMNHQFLMPLDAKRELARPYFAAIKKIEELSPADQQQIVNIFNENSGSGNGNWASDESVRMAQQKTLMFLRDKGMITQAELDAAIQSVTEMDRASQTMFDEIVAQHRVDLTLWLQGGTKDCVLKTGGPAMVPQPPVDGGSTEALDGVRSTE